MLGRKLGLVKEVLADRETGRFEFVYEMPFDSVLKRMSSAYRIRTDGRIRVYTKGALESVLSVCGQVLLPESTEPQPLNQDRTQAITQVMAEMASKGLRVLGLAAKDLDSVTEQAILRSVSEECCCSRCLTGAHIARSPCPVAAPSPWDTGT